MEPRDLDGRVGKGALAVREAVSANAVAFAAGPAPVPADILAAGQPSLRAMPEELTSRGIGTRRGGQWQGLNVEGLPQEAGIAGQG